MTRPVTNLSASDISRSIHSILNPIGCSLTAPSPYGIRGRRNCKKKHRLDLTPVQGGVNCPYPTNLANHSLAGFLTEPIESDRKRLRTSATWLVKACCKSALPLNRTCKCLVFRLRQSARGLAQSKTWRTCPTRDDREAFWTALVLLVLYRFSPKARFQSTSWLSLVSYLGGDSNGFSLLDHLA